ncbi:MAG: hypothetical protein K0S53_955 [Bacteroidetes bacterium]|jgi:hypothetical protein|nr:hypothetical protein [Bacteroidota bacterium]MDF2453900.1 hypothetical protein [Bacteroidota bacterium]
MKRVIILSAYLLLQLSCQTTILNLSSETSAQELIKDCPEEMISDHMPNLGKSNTVNQYYIYKGLRKEIKEFDSVWVREHCKVKVTIVH